MMTRKWSPGVDTLSPGFCSSPAVNVARFLLSLIITIICQYTHENKEFHGAEVCSSLLLTIRKYFFTRSEIAPLFLQALYCWFWLVFSLRSSGLEFSPARFLCMLAPCQTLSENPYRYSYVSIITAPCDSWLLYCTSFHVWLALDCSPWLNICTWCSVFLCRHDACADGFIVCVSLCTTAPILGMGLPCLCRLRIN